MALIFAAFRTWLYRSIIFGLIHPARGLNGSIAGLTFRDQANQTNGGGHAIDIQCRQLFWRFAMLSSMSRSAHPEKPHRNLLSAAAELPLLADEAIGFAREDARASAGPPGIGSASSAVLPSPSERARNDATFSTLCF